MKVNYQGTLEDDVLVDRGLSWNIRYILDDGDYEKLTRGISEGQKIKNIVFNIEGEKKFEFSEDIFDYILENTPKEMAVQTDYDKNLHKQIYRTWECNVSDYIYCLVVGEFLSILIHPI